MVFGQVFNTIKNKAGSFFGAVNHTAKNWMNGFHSAPGYYRYCGDGNPLENGEPINATDSACRVHDYEYSAMAKNKDKISKDDLHRMVRESDNKLVDAINRSGDSDLGSLMSKYMIKGKMKLEDWGLLSPDKFVVE